MSQVFCPIQSPLHHLRWSHSRCFPPTGQNRRHSDSGSIQRLPLPQLGMVFQSCLPWMGVGRLSCRTGPHNEVRPLLGRHFCSLSASSFALWHCSWDGSGPVWSFATWNLSRGFASGNSPMSTRRRHGLWAVVVPEVLQNVRPKVETAVSTSRNCILVKLSCKLEMGIGKLSTKLGKTQQPGLAS